MDVARERREPAGRQHTCAVGVEPLDGVAVEAVVQRGPGAGCHDCDAAAVRVGKDAAGARGCVVQEPVECAPVAGREVACDDDSAAAADPAAELLLRVGHSLVHASVPGHQVHHSGKATYLLQVRGVLPHDSDRAYPLDPAQGSDGVLEHRDPEPASCLHREPEARRGVIQVRLGHECQPRAPTVHAPPRSAAASGPRVGANSTTS